jgi:DNA-binding transcriptional MerR regulator
MKTGEVAKLLGRDRVTLYRWMEQPELTKFFSSGALGTDGGSQRTFTEGDLLVLNTIRHLKDNSRLIEFSEIAESLDTGSRITSFPDSALTPDNRVISVPHAEKAAEVVALQMALDDAREEIRRLRDSNDTKDKELRRLEREIGKLMGLLEAQQQQKKSE